eukprot:Selendium_serpulae@DN4001_c0_g1_i1.p4
MASTAPASKDQNKSVFELNKFLNKKVRVKFNGGREVVGVLRGHDTVANLVLDETEEYIRDPQDPYKLTSKTRTLGLIVARGSAIMLISPLDGLEEIANPFVNMQG